MFDLGSLLIIAATGGLEVLSDDFFSSLSSQKLGLDKYCCPLHAPDGGNKTLKNSKEDNESIFGLMYKFYM